MKRGALLVCCVAFAACLVPQQAIAQSASTPAPQVRQRVNRIAADLFSTAPHLNDDIRELKDILAADANLAEAHMLLGIAYRGLGSPDMLSEAVAEFRQAIALNPSYVPARLYLSYVYLDIGRPQRAKEELEAALEQSPGNPQLLALEGAAERDLKNPQRAVELIQQALKADPSSAEGRYYLGLALFDLGKRQEAMKELEQVVASGQAAADAYLSLGTIYVETGRLDDAVNTLSKGTEIDDARPDLHILLARAYRLKGMLAKAAEQLRLARPKPGAPLAPSEFRQQQLEFDLTVEQGALAMQRGQLTTAIASFKRALTMDPANGPANRYLAQTYLRQGSFAEAAQYAARAEKAGAPLPPADLARLRAAQRK
jgi:tetratricopeptide (TPR) repeat protein